MKKDLKNYMKGELSLMNKKDVVKICGTYLNIPSNKLDKMSKEQIISKYIKERNRAILWS